MLIHLTGSARDLKNDLVYLRVITETVHECESSLARNWIEAAANRVLRGGLPDRDVDWQHIIEDNECAVKDADVVIVEASTGGFLLGYEVCYALALHKPVLIVSRPDVNSRVLSGLEDRGVAIKEYSTERELRKIVSAFIFEHAVPEKEIVQQVPVTPALHKYLEHEGKRTGYDKSELLLALAEKGLNSK